MSPAEKYPSVLGLPIEEAKRRLLRAGAIVTEEGVFSKKGVEGADDLRVIRQQTDGNAVRLTYSAFITQIKE